MARRSTIDEFKTVYKHMKTNGMSFTQAAEETGIVKSSCQALKKSLLNGTFDPIKSKVSEKEHAQLLKLAKEAVPKRGRHQRVPRIRTIEAVKSGVKKKEQLIFLAGDANAVMTAMKKFNLSAMQA